MRAIILAAGVGNRMRPLTDEIHKTLIVVGGQTILGRIIEGLEKNGITQILVVTGYRAAEVEGWVREHHSASTVEFQFVRNDRFRETNNIFSMALAFAHIPLDDDVLLIESDLVCEHAVFERIVRTPHPNAALVDGYSSGMDGTVVTVSDGIITNVIPPHLQTGDFSFTDKYKTLNIYKFSRELCRAFKQLLGLYTQVDESCYYELVLGILIYVNKAVVGAEILDGERWAEIDDGGDLQNAEFEFSPERRRELLGATQGGYWCHAGLVDFSYLRNMHFPTSAIFAELRSNLAAVLQNYGSRQSVLDRKLALFLLCNADRVVSLNGASQIYPFLANYLKEKRVVVPSPTFGEYARAFPEHETYRDDFGVSSDEVLKRVHQGVDVLVFVNPNNPTGTTLESAWIHAVAAENPGVLVIVDESFIAFSGQTSIVEHLERAPLPNVLVITSLSKALGVPGLRLGYVYTCDPALRGRILDALPIWNLNSPAEHLLEIILKHRDSLAASYRATAADRALFASDLARVPAIETVHPSGGNFLLVTMHEGAPSGDAIVDRLLQRATRPCFYVKDVSARFLGGRTRVRLAVRSPAENRMLAAALSGVWSPSTHDGRIVE